MSTSAPDIARRAASRLAVEFGLTRKQRDRVVEVVAEEVVASGSPLKPGAGWQALSEARKLLSENENPPSQNPTLSRQA